ncbi:MAG: ferric iron uptake transcriptional regulator [Coxiellaceae bacterium]|nr:ferric iron uptake transcriptional regulator [Coxiellaceae bacterium]
MEDDNLRKAGLKVTMPRMKVLRILEEANPHHLSAEDVFQRLKDMGEEVGLATVYRVLTQFDESGLIVRHNFEGGHSVFEIDQGEHHDHLVCVKCNRVEEFVDDVIEARQQHIADQANFQMTDHSLTIYGVCRHCAVSDDA